MTPESFRSSSPYGSYSMPSSRKTLLDDVYEYERRVSQDLDNPSDRVIKPIFKANGLRWNGWHAYRRGLATNLHELGVPDIVIQAILRHEDVRTTQRSYIKTVPRVVTAATERLESQIACTAVVRQRAASDLLN